MFLRTLVFVFTFLLRCRFPRNQSIANVLNRRYGYRTTQLFRKLEKSSKQYMKATLDKDFLLRCKIYDVTPKFMKFKLYRKCLHNSTFYKSCLQQLMEMEISFKKRKIDEHMINVNLLKN